MKIVVIDGQGGRLGQLLVEGIKKSNINCDLYAIGTNSNATASMLKAGADYGATGENPVVVACSDADIIVGPIGIISADSMLGEITSTMAVAVGKSRATKILLPTNGCKNQVVGVKQMSMNEIINETIVKLKEILR